METGSLQARASLNTVTVRVHRVPAEDHGFRIRVEHSAKPPLLGSRGGVGERRLRPPFLDCFRTTNLRDFVQEWASARYREEAGNERPRSVHQWVAGMANELPGQSSIPTPPRRSRCSPSYPEPHLERAAPALVKAALNAAKFP